MTLPNTAPTDHDQVSPAANEIAGGQFLHLHSVKCFRIEVPVKAFQRFVFGESRFPDAARHCALTPCAGFGAQQPVEKAQVRVAFLLRPREEFIESCGLDGNSQRREVAQAAITQLSRLVRCLRLHRLSSFPPVAVDTRRWNEGPEESGAESHPTAPVLPPPK